MVVGIDEVGRGSLAGPLTVSAVILTVPIIGLRDSKKLSRSQRTRLAIEIYDKALDVSIGWVWPKEIDRIGLTAATTLAIKRALAKLNLVPNKIIIDGSFNYLRTFKNVTTIIGADDKIAEVSAASIIAKVARDDYMLQADKLYPSYGFALNVGYGTKQHLNSLEKNGLSPIHRLSFKPCNGLLSTA